MSHNNGIHHVIRSTWNPGDRSVCGRVMWTHDMPIGIEHASACIEQGTYLQPCKKCMSKIRGES